MPESVYPHPNFPIFPDRPYFYANFVQTLDGKVQALAHTEDYWPIGSRLDYATLIELRSHADALVHGSATAPGHPTVTSLAKPEFRAQRERNGKPAALPYFVATRHPTPELIDHLAGSTPVTFACPEDAAVPKLPENMDTLRAGRAEVEIPVLAAKLHALGMRHVLVEGGPRLFRSFLAAGLIDELFLTIAPKLFGGGAETSLTLVGGELFPAAAVPRFTLLSVQPEGDELYLRYKRA